MLKTGELLRQLREREKELDALYKLSVLYTSPDAEPSSIVSGTALILRDSMQYPGRAFIRVEAQEISAEAGDGALTPVLFSHTESYSIDREVLVEAGYCAPENDRRDDSYVNVPDLLERERRLLSSAAALLANVLQKNELENVLRESAAVLQKQTEDLEHKNIALREVLSGIETDRQRLVGNTRTYLDTVIRPELLQILLDGNLSDRQEGVIKNVLHSLESAVDGRYEGILMEIQPLLSPREFGICTLIRNGLSTKEIAAHLGITDLTVERHRNTIRRKLGINGKRTNLTTFLRTGEI